jgi:hypothetical protein
MKSHILLLVVLFAALSLHADEPKVKTHEAAPPKPANTEKSSKTKKSTNWIYKEIPDKMAEGKIKVAYSKSVNTISLSAPPFTGAQHGTLTLRIYPQNSNNDVMLSIEKGQFLTEADGHCEVLVHFDDGEAQSLWADKSISRSSGGLFIAHPSKFIATLKQAKKVKLEAPIFQEGIRAFEFNVEGLKWELASPLQAAPAAPDLLCSFYAAKLVSEAELKYQERMKKKTGVFDMNAVYTAQSELDQVNLLIDKDYKNYKLDFYAQCPSGLVEVVKMKQKMANAP